MKNRFIVAVFIIAYFFRVGALYAAASSPASASPASIDHNYLQLTPDLQKATMGDGYVSIPFNVTNNYSEDIVIRKPLNRIDGLMTVSDSGQVVYIENFRNPTSGRSGGGPEPQPVLLKPGQSSIFDCVYSVETLKFVADKRKEIFGAITGHLSRTDEKFRSYSPPFQIPAALIKQP